MTDIAIRVENLGKMYRIAARQERHHTISTWLSASLRDMLATGLGASISRLSPLVHRTLPNRKERRTVSEESFWALKDVSFEACPELSRRV